VGEPDDGGQHRQHCHARVSEANTRYQVTPLGRRVRGVVTNANARVLTPGLARSTRSYPRNSPHEASWPPGDVLSHPRAILDQFIADGLAAA
jgi:hypothetical protein